MNKRAVMNYPYRTREPSLKPLFPQTPGRWTTDDLNLEGIGCSVWAKRDILSTMQGVRVQTVIKGNFSEKIKRGDCVNVHLIAWYTNHRDREESM